MGDMSHQVATPPVVGDDGERFLSNADLRRRYHKSRMTIHRWVKAGILPPPVMISTHRRATRLSELQAREKSWPRVLPTD